jgi:hypothetical protein
MALRAAKRDEAAAQSPSPGATATGYPRVFNGAGPGPTTAHGRGWRAVPTTP